MVFDRENNMEIIKSSDLDESFFKGIGYDNIPRVKEIISDIKSNGDSAIKKYIKEFDGVSNEDFKISRTKIKEAYSRIDKNVLEAIGLAAKNIEEFARIQMSQFNDIEIEIMGNKVGQRIVPIEKIGCYVPGGGYPLPSTALMTVIPAKIAGVKEIIVCSPKITQETIVAADMAGADKIYDIGGIQAIAAMAYGSETTPSVDKIVGPGNKFVTAAKKEVFGDVGIDFLAGPSEVLIIADGNARADFIAADLLAQAEHDFDARADLITTSEGLAKNVLIEIDRQLNNIKTKDVAGESIKKGKIIIVESLDSAVKISNRLAPEHLEIMIKDPNEIIPELNNYGSLFIGSYSAEVFGDYCSGTNHTLPTNRASRYTGGLSVKDFVKILTYQEIRKNKIDKMINTASELAGIEGLDAHKNAALIRKK